MKVIIDRTKAVTQHFLKKSFKKKNRNTEKIVCFSFFKCLLRFDVLRVFVLFCVLILYGSFCHNVLNLDISSLFTTFSL